MDTGEGEKTVNDKEIVIIGGGPAGLAASIEAAKAGAKVLVIDENKKIGGQLFKQIHKFFGSYAHNAGVRGINITSRLLEEAQKLGIEIWCDSAVIGLFSKKTLAVVRDMGQKKVTLTVKAQKVLIATGASENAINFPGWTLPGVMGAGAAQTMINVERVLPGKRVLMVGSGNVGLIVTYQLLQAGAEVIGIIEAMNKIGGYGVHAAKVSRAGVPFYLSHTIIRADGNHNGVNRAVIAEIDENWMPISKTEKEFHVDTVCIAAGLRPLSELARMYDLKHAYIPELGGWVPIHNENMESSVSGVYVAGDASGVEEANTAMDEGRLVGVDMAQSLGYLNKETGEALKAEIRSRLETLRQGPFGEKRLLAKKKIIEKGYAV